MNAAQYAYHDKLLSLRVSAPLPVLWPRLQPLVVHYCLHHACDAGPSAPLANLSAPAAISATTSVHAAEQPVLPLEILSADAPGGAELQCALKGGRTLPVAPLLTHSANSPTSS
jgi:hypothetical protein